MPARDGPDRVLELQKRLVQHRASIQQGKQSCRPIGMVLKVAPDQSVKGTCPTRIGSRTPRTLSSPRSSFSKSMHLLKTALRLVSSARLW